MFTIFVENTPCTNPIPACYADLTDRAIMQSTLLTDFDGNEIFDGDIVQMEDETNICNGKYGLVLWALESWMVEDDEGALDMEITPENAKLLVVAGNIYETPDLFPRR